MLKYNIIHKINKLPHSIAKEFKKKAPEQLQCTPDTLRNWLYIKTEDTREIRADALIQIAEWFGVQPKELYTIPPKKLRVKKETVLHNQLTIEDYDNYSEI